MQLRQDSLEVGGSAAYWFLDEFIYHLEAF